VKRVPIAEALEVEAMLLNSLLYYVLVGDGRKDTGDFVQS
jgi:hypothetical protein